MPPERPTVPPLLAMSFAILAVSTSAIFIRYAQEDAPSLVIASYRLGFASLVLWPILLWRQSQDLRSLAGKQLKWSILSGIFLAAHFATWISSLEYTSVASSLVLVATAPLFVTILSPRLLKEPITRPVLIGLVASIAGSSIVGLSDACEWSSGIACPPWSEFIAGSAVQGDFLALMGAVSAAGYMMIGRKLRPSVALLPYITIAYSSAAIALIVASLMKGYSLSGYPTQAYLWFVLLAIFPQLIAHSTYNWALRYLPVAFVSIMLLGEPIGSSLLAFALLGERPTSMMLIGGILILIGIVWASKRTGDQT